MSPGQEDFVRDFVTEHRPAKNPAQNESNIPMSKSHNIAIHSDTLHQAEKHQCC